MTLYETLGVGPEATAEEIRDAYRRAVKKTHPDTAGGDREAFQRVQHAYDILSDASKRAAYDRDGDQGGVQIPTPSSILAEAFNHVLDFEIRVDPVTGTRMLLNERLKLEQNNLKQHEREAEKWRKILKRIERDGGDGILESVVEGRMEPHLRGAEKARGLINSITLALKLLTSYRYRDDAAREFFELTATFGMDLEEEAPSIAPEKPKRRRKAA